MKKYVFVTGGVVSGLGKGVVVASLGRLLKARGLTVALQKLDPYINVDPGTMSPYEHGEIFVTEDGAETDIDIGRYERFIDENLDANSNLTTGKVLWNVLNKERRGEFLGSTVQIIPHVTNEIKDFIYSVGNDTNADVALIEIGGTTGDIESQSFLEAIRQVAIEVGRENSLFIHVTLVPFLSGNDEHKTKPTQRSVKELQGAGINADLVILRCDEPLEDGVIDKIAMSCNVKKDCIIEDLTLPVLYEVPLALERQGFSEIVCRELGIRTSSPDMAEWEKMVDGIKHYKREVNIALVGKYVASHDAYLSVVEALRHAGYAHDAKINLQWTDSEKITSETVDEILGNADGIVVPGGFGIRGIDGKILSAKYAREHDIPYLGICLGMQISVIEFARNVCGLVDADSGEFAPDSKHKVIDYLSNQNDEVNMGGTLRLGAYPCKIANGTLLHDCYGKDEIFERFRHRYEVNNEYLPTLTQSGLVVGGTSEGGVVAIENPKCKFFVGVQYHPEFKSRPNEPHPLFTAFIGASIGK